MLQLQHGNTERIKFHKITNDIISASLWDQLLFIFDTFRKGDNCGYQFIHIVKFQLKHFYELFNYCIVLDDIVQILLNTVQCTWCMFHLTENFKIS